MSTSVKLAQSAKYQAMQELWRRCDLDWKLKPHQLKVYKLIKAKQGIPNNRFVLNCSRRWGKTYLLSVIAVEFALSNPKAFIFFTASTQKQVRTAVKAAFDHILKDCPEHMRPVFTVNEGYWTFPNGSRIEFSGLDAGRIEKRRGATANLIICDEAGFCDSLKHAVESVLFPMTSTTGGQMILSSNAPLTPGHDFVKIFTRQAQEQGNYAKQTVYDANFTDAEVERFAAQCGGFESTTFRREYMGEFTIDADSAIVPEFGAKRPVIVVDSKRPPFFNTLVAIDLGLIDHTGALFGYYDFIRAKVVIEAEALLKKTNSDKLVKECRAMELKLWGDIAPKRIADGQRYTLNDISTVHNYPVGVVRKDAVEAQVNSLRLDIQNDRLEINPRCVRLIGQIEDAIWDRNRTKFGRDSEDGHNDLLACLVYFVRHIDRHSNPFPRGYGFDFQTTRLKEGKNTSSMEALKSLFTPKR